MRKGELTGAVNDRSVFRQLHKGAVRMTRGSLQENAVLDGQPGELSDLRIATAGPLPGYENMPWRQVTAAANSLAADGAVLRQLLLQGVIPQTMEEAGLRETMKQFAAEAAGYAVTFSSADIQVSDQVSMPQYFVTGMGTHCALRTWIPGQELVAVRQIGLAGTAALAHAYELELRGRFPLWLIERAKGFDRWMSLTEAARAVNHFGGCSMCRIAQGGIFNALWRMADASGVGLEVDLREIPVYQETIEICEYFDVNPYYLYSEGALLVGTDRAEELIDALAKEQLPACVIGQVTDGNDRVIRNGENRRYLDRPQQDELWRLFEKAGTIR